MSNLKTDLFTSLDNEGSIKALRSITSIITMLIFTSLLIIGTGCVRPEKVFDVSGLIKPGDNVTFGSYVIYKIDEGIYKINDPGVTTGRGGAWGVDMYLIRGSKKAFLIDLGNNYIKGYEKDLLSPRENASEEFLAVIDGLIGRLPLEAGVTHMHPDHNGMTEAFTGREVKLWVGEGEDTTALKVQHGLDPSIYTVFRHGEKAFDLGGGRVVETFRVRGHSNGGTVYILKKDRMLFTSDALGSGIGQSMRSVERLSVFAEDSQKLVEYIKANFLPYERYGLKVFTGHTWQNVYGGFMSPDREKVDLGYLDWRFVQDVASCAKGITEGRWLREGSGLFMAGKMEYTDSWPGAAGQAIMVYGTGTIIIPYEIACEAAGLEQPK